MGFLKWTGDTDISVPIYVTRKTAGGETGSYTMPLKNIIKLMLAGYYLAWLWILIGFVFGIKLLVGLALSAF